MKNIIFLLIYGAALGWLAIISGKQFWIRRRAGEPLIQDKIDEQLSLMVLGISVASVVCFLGAFGIIDIPLVK